MDIFMRMLLCEKVKLEPAFLSTQFKDEVLRRLKAKVEGVCTRHGYIKPGSIEVHKICIGKVEMIGLNGMTQYDVYFHADICNPLLGSTIRCRVSNFNKFGILAEAESVIEAVIPKNSIDIHSDVDLEKVRIGDDIIIEVVGKKYELNDKKICLVGRIVQDKSIKDNMSISSAKVLPYEEEDEQDPQDPILEMDGGAGEEEEEEEDDDEDPEQEDSETDGDQEDEDQEDDKEGNAFFEESENLSLFGSDDEGDVDADADDSSESDFTDDD